MLLIILVILIDCVASEFSYRIHKLLIRFYNTVKSGATGLTSITRARVNVSLTLLKDF